jgi:hypothetical protein
VLAAGEAARPGCESKASAPHQQSEPPGRCHREFPVQCPASEVRPNLPHSLRRTSEAKGIGNLMIQVPLIDLKVP